MKIAGVESGIRKEAAEADIHEKCRKIRAVFFHRFFAAETPSVHGGGFGVPFKKKALVANFLRISV